MRIVVLLLLLLLPICHAEELRFKYTTNPEIMIWMSFTHGIIARPDGSAIRLGHLDPPKGEAANSDEAWAKFHDKIQRLMIKTTISKEAYEKLFFLAKNAMQSQELTNENNATNLKKKVVTIKFFHEPDISISFISFPEKPFTDEVSELIEYVNSIHLPVQLLEVIDQPQATEN